MKTTILQLKKIIREALKERGWVTGRWYPGEGEPVDSADLDNLGRGGFSFNDELEEEAATDT